MLPLLAITFLAPGLVGTVREAGSREPISYAAVRSGRTGETVIADVAGVFFMPGFGSQPGLIRVEAPGYEPVELEVDPSRHPVEILLEPRPFRVTELRIERDRDLRASAAASAWRIQGDEIGIAPNLAEADVFRALQELPAVTSYSDFSSGLYVRGGTPDQTNVLLDGAPLFNPYHLGGLFSAIDPAALAVAELYTTAPPVDAGDRLSGELRLVTREGGRDRWRSTGAIGLLSARVAADGPLTASTTALFSIRRTYVDFLVDAARAVNLTDRDLPYGFTDMHLKVTHRYSRHGSIAIAGYRDVEGLGSLEGFGVDRPLDGRWATHAFSLHQRQLLPESWSLENVIAFSRFGGDLLYGDVRTPGLDFVDAGIFMQTLRIGTSATWYHRGGQARVGAQVEHLEADHRIRSTGGTAARLFPNMVAQDALTSVALYANEERAIGAHGGLSVGLRAVLMPDHHAMVLPRLRTWFAAGPRSTFTFSLGRSTQTWQSLRNEEATAARLFAYDIQLPIGAELPIADEASAGFVHDGGRFDARAEVFARRYRNLLVPPLPSDVDEAPVLVSEGLVAAEGRTVGTELRVEGSLFGGRASLSHVWQHQERSAGGATYTPGFTREHTLRASYLHPLGESGVASARFIWGSGLPYTPATGAMRAFRLIPGSGLLPGNEVAVLGPHNKSRLPGYIRLDVAIRGSRTLRLFGHTVVVAPYLQVFNLLNSRNALLAKPTIRAGKARIEYAPQMPILPTVGVEWRF